MLPHIWRLLVSGGGGFTAYPVFQQEEYDFDTGRFLVRTLGSTLHTFVYFLTLFIPCSFCTHQTCHIKSQFTIYRMWVILDTYSLLSLTLIAKFAQLPKLAFLQLTTGELFVGLGMQDPPMPYCSHPVPRLLHSASCACVPVSNTLLSSHLHPLLYIMTLHKNTEFHTQKKATS